MQPIEINLSQPNDSVLSFWNYVYIYIYIYNCKNSTHRHLAIMYILYIIYLSIYLYIYIGTCEMVHDVGKLTRWPEFKSWTRLFSFLLALVLLQNICVHLFSFQLWINSRADSEFKPVKLGSKTDLVSHPAHTVGLGTHTHTHTHTHIYIYIYIYIYICILQSSKSGIGNNSVRTNKIFKFKIFKYSW